MCHDAQEIPITLGLSCSISQGSILGPLLWNIAFNVVLQFPMPRGTITIKIADDKLVVAKRDTVDEVEGRANTAFRVVSECTRGLGLDLAVKKTQAVVIIKR